MNTPAPAFFIFNVIVHDTKTLKPYLENVEASLQGIRREKNGLAKELNERY
ncbi:hypothetical protein HGT70_07115 [Rosenbergiella collisarenosi]|uniref:hypothetical protein n=1 Tax=Rosenbergiella collisarenosi TaxID=1544695 RepID=UPI001BD98809|nr:hypothetical protein [Rosenbergiella collisarenosi]MBT0721052.1 hypothetical protein [Rosenbergiella collisarenosi]